MGGFQVVLLFAMIGWSAGHSLATRNVTTKCGDWQPYKETKCIKVVKTAGQQTYEDATIVCQAFVEGLDSASNPKILTIKSKEEQRFLHKFLFTDDKYLDNVWLGLREKEEEPGVLEWNDGAKIKYTNWANDTKPIEDHRCVQMTAGKESDPAGTWLWASCQKRNDVVCEMTPIVNVESLLNWFSNHRFELESLLEAAEGRISSLEEQLQQEIGDRRENDAELLYNLTEIVAEEVNKTDPIPVNFVYVQLPGQAAPADIWPQAEWQDISFQYAGLFFRVVGGNSSSFNESDVQEASTVRLAQVESAQAGQANVEHVEVPGDGSWSQYVKGGSSDARHTRFRLSTDEIRPQNQAVKVWQRTR